jgi:hypothetical protein
METTTHICQFSNGIVNTIILNQEGELMTYRWFPAHCGILDVDIEEHRAWLHATLGFRNPSTS